MARREFQCADAAKWSSSPSGANNRTNRRAKAVEAVPRSAKSSLQTFCIYYSSRTRKPSSTEPAGPDCAHGNDLPMRDTTDAQNCSGRGFRASPSIEFWIPELQYGEWATVGGHRSHVRHAHCAEQFKISIDLRSPKDILSNAEEAP